MRAISVLVAAGALAAASAASAVTVTAPASGGGWLGFMNVFELPANGGGFVFASSWGVPDLNASFNDPASEVTMSPNTINDPDPFWYQGGGGPGAPGNKIMEANLYIQVDDDSLAGQTVTFEGFVTDLSYTAAHDAYIFIRDFAPDFSSVNETIIPVTGTGAFSLSLNTDPGLGRHVQYGFQSVGENVWSTDVAPFGSVTFSSVPAPATAAIAALGAPALLRRRRR